MSLKRYKLTKRKTRRNRKKTKKKTKKYKFKYELYYFKMNKCKWCIEFQEKLLKKLIKIKNLKIKTFIGPNNPILIQKFNIKIYPTLIAFSNSHYKIFNKERTITNILKFLQ